jgi:N4-gp56 family major capsid protein
MSSSSIISSNSTSPWQTLKLSSDVRRAAINKMVWRQFTRPEAGFGPHMGQTYAFTKTSRVAQRGREIGEFDPVPITTFTITESTVAFAEYSNSIQYTMYASMFSELSLEHVIIKALVDDAADVIDRVTAATFQGADLVYTPTGTVSTKSYIITTNGVAGARSTRPMSAWDIKNIYDLMRGTYNIPGYQGTRKYVCVGSVNALRNIRDDNEWIEASKYAQPNMLLNSEVGEYAGIRFVDENNVLTNVLPGGCGEMIFFGDDPVVEVEMYPLEVQLAIADSYGRYKGIRWTTMVGFARTWSFATEGQTRIMRVFSL